MIMHYNKRAIRDTGYERGENNYTRERIAQIVKCIT